jgi:hypothetical protein
MIKTTLLASLALLVTGCASYKYYDDQWSKAGATEADWKKDSHECELETHQRDTYDDIQHQNYVVQQRMFGGAKDWTSTAGKIENMPYWEQCMRARSWQVKAILLGPDATRSTRTFKP